MTNFEFDKVFDDKFLKLQFDNCFICRTSSELNDSITIEVKNREQKIKLLHEIYDNCKYMCIGNTSKISCYYITDDYEKYLKHSENADDTVEIILDFDEPKQPEHETRQSQKIEQCKAGDFEHILRKIDSFRVFTARTRFECIAESVENFRNEKCFKSSINIPDNIYPTNDFEAFIVFYVFAGRVPQSYEMVYFPARGIYFDVGLIYGRNNKTRDYKILKKYKSRLDEFKKRLIE